MTEIEIKNFQSIKKINFSINGFTVIVGKNNVGKSAIIRAIEAALTNQAGKDYIRKGEKQTEVEIKRENLDIKWKKAASANYIINKEPFKKLNRDVPKILTDAGFEKMEIGDSKIFPLVASQFEPLFLINKPGSVITEVLASLYNIDTLSIADDLCQKTLRSQKILLKTREKDSTVLKEKLEKFKDFEQMKEIVNTLVKKEKAAQQLESDTKEIISYENRLHELTDLLKKLKPITKIKFPDISYYEKNFIELQKLQKLEHEYNKLIGTVTQLKTISDIAVPSTKKIEILLEEVILLSKWNNNLNTLKKEVKQKRDILNSFNYDDITKIFDKIKIMVDETVLIENLEEEFTKSVISARGTREELKIVTEKYNEKHNELNGKICPTCERPYGN